MWMINESCSVGSFVNNSRATLTTLMQAWLGSTDQYIGYNHTYNHHTAIDASIQMTISHWAPHNDCPHATP